ncbi:DUF2141 domain-containing protein [Olleya sp. YS]|uniref:DUF2141 domain-containing protein n=1 Tax=Olleya sp. YS TaxID=3028318 RepID=UPI002434146E|nr:DUF2141 domain-containing protein [Olleya sp. YS]WGD35030.1 DUF2141 domain-containing protein [Olleya sp. YS]
MKTSTTPNQLKSNLLTTLVLFVLSLTLSVAQTDTKVTTEEGQTITVTIDNVKNNTGQVVFALHTKDTWMKGQGVQNTTTTIENNSVTITFTNVQPGTYSIMALHDVNNNNRMDFENGMPQESYGMSNNPMSYGPPQFSEAKFEVTNEDLEFNIRF